MKLIAPYFDYYAGQQAEQDLFSEALKEQGIVCTPWQVEGESFPEAEAILWQGISGYYQRMEVFESLLQQVENRGIVSFNSPDLLRWNSHKTYLQTLSQKGVSIIPTLWRNGWDEEAVRHFAKENSCAEIVVKPCLSAGAYLTFRIALTDTDAMRKAAEAYRDYPEIALMIQPFCPEIVTEGEWSLMYFDGQFSHAVLKTPKQGDYRIQHVHGGMYRRVEPQPEMLATAQVIFSLLPETPLYARVDGIRTPAGFRLMEVELIEPYFYLDAAPEKAEIFAQAVKRRMQ